MAMPKFNGLAKLNAMARYPPRIYLLKTVPNSSSGKDEEEKVC